MGLGWEQERSWWEVWKREEKGRERRESEMARSESARVTLLPFLPFLPSPLLPCSTYLTHVRPHLSFLPRQFFPLSKIALSLQFDSPRSPLLPVLVFSSPIFFSPLTDRLFRLTLRCCRFFSFGW